MQIEIYPEYFTCYKDAVTQTPFSTAEVPAKNNDVVCSRECRKVFFAQAWRDCHAVVFFQTDDCVIAIKQ